jgi:hypothetical protein
MHGRWKTLLLSLMALSQLAASCNKPDVPVFYRTNFDVMYASQTSSLDSDKIAGEKKGRIRFDTIMDYLGIMPTYDDQYTIVLDQPTIFGSDCTHFLSKADPDNQQNCGRASMLGDYVAHTRARPPFVPLPPERLIIVVSPFQPYLDAEVLGTAVSQWPRDINHEAAVLYDDQISSFATTSDYRWRALGELYAHELGHILAPGPITDPLTHPEESPDLHNPDYAYGCIMKKGLTLIDVSRRYKDNPLIFCRTTGAQPDTFRTCHGILRYMFNLPYEVQH